MKLLRRLFHELGACRAMLIVPAVLIAAVTLRLHGIARVVGICLLLLILLWLCLERRWLPLRREGLVLGLGLAMVIGLVTGIYVDLSISGPTLPGAALFLCFVLWLWSAVCFGLLLATSRPRKVVISSLGLALVSGLVLVGLVPRNADGWLNWRPLLSIVLFATLIAPAILYARGPSVGAAGTPLRDRLLHGVGVALSLVAAALAVAALGLATTHESRLRVEAAAFRKQPASAVRIPVRTFSGLSDRTLLSAFMPAPVLAPGLGSVGLQDVHPVSASDYFDEATMLKINTGEVAGRASSHGIPSRCAVGAPPCYVLSCPDCHPPGLDPTLPFYGLVFRRGAPSGAGLNWNAAQRAHLGDLETVLQYWVFYADDHWSTKFLGVGDLVQEHEADWESVTIGLSSDRPLFVATSAHHGGIWQPWDSLASVTTDYLPQQNETANPEPPFDLHPVVAVAIGSHAFYPIGYRGRAPDWATSRLGILPARMMDWVSGAANVTETLDTTVQLAPTLFPEIEVKAVMAYPGYWSYGDRYELQMPYHTLTSGPGDQPHGPKTPTLQPLGADPVGTIFADRRWIKYSGS